MVSSTPQIFRDQGAVCRQGKAELVKRSKCRLIMWVLCLLWEGWNISPQWNIGWVQVSRWVTTAGRVIAPEPSCRKQSTDLVAQGKPEVRQICLSVFWWCSMLMILPPVHDKHAQLTSLRPNNQRQGSSHWWNTLRALDMVWIKTTMTTHRQVLKWAQKGVFFKCAFSFNMSASSKYKSGPTAAALSSADQEKGAKRNVILWHQGFKECFQAAITFLLCVHDLSCWVQVLAWALAAIEGKWLCMRHLDQLPAGCCCSPHPPPDYQGYRLAQICSGLRPQASPLQL